MTGDDLLEPSATHPAAAAGAPPTPPGAASAGPNHFATVFAFVDDFLVHVYARLHHESTPFKWCPWWHHHPEAVSRLSALWQAFEALRQEPGTGGATWWTTYADPIMGELTSTSGPFQACTTERHTPSTPLLTTPASTPPPSSP